MPIHDQSYHRYRGEKRQLGLSWLVITWAHIQTLVRKRTFLGLLIFAWIPFIVRAVQMYVAANFAQAAILQPSAQTFRDYLDQQSPFLFFVTVYVGAGLIANDRRANALQIYLSKPLTRAEYIAGKLAVLLAFLLLVTWIPGILLLIVQMLFAGSFAFIKANLFLFPAITLTSFIHVLLAAFTMLALSSLSNSSRFVGIMYAGAVLFSSAMFNVLRGITGSSRAAWLSFGANVEQIGDVIFRLPPRYDTPWMVSLIAIAALIAVSISILERRVRGVEVVT